MNYYNLYEGDCFQVLPNLKDHVADLIITDPPYNILNHDDIIIKNKRSVVRTEEFDKKVLNIKNLCQQIYRLLKDGGTFYIFMSDRQIGKYIEEIKQSGLTYSNTLVWYQKSGFPSVRKRAYQSHCQYIAYGHKEIENAYTFNFKSSKEMRNLLEFEGCVSFEYKGGSPGEYLGHPTQKPSKLIKHLMEISSNKYETVLDPFIGSGTTMWVAQNLRRDCIGMELDPKYIEMTKKRCFTRTFLDREVKYDFIRKRESKTVG